MKQSDDMKVLVSAGDRDSAYCECGEALGRGAWITLVEGKGALYASFPPCPAGRERTIGEYACCKYSGRIGRSAAVKSLDEEAIRLAVTTHVRSAEIRYDVLLAGGRRGGKFKRKWRERQGKRI
jgi:hypothetical protein